MLAARFHSAGPPAVLQVDEVPEPRSPEGDELLVHVAASSVNGTDLGLRRGDLRIATVGRLPFVVGFDLAGEVVRCGPAVTAFRPGDRVMALLPHRGGGQAERVLVRQGRAARIPAAVPDDVAAAVPLAGLTALQALHGKAGLHARTRPRVLVLGASGGIGSFGVQLARLAGAHVTAVSSGTGVAFAAELGADEVVDRAEHDPLRLGERWDVVLDSPGVLSLSAARPALAGGGMLVSTRPISADAVRSLVPQRLRGSGPRFAAVMTQARSQDLSLLGELVATGRLRPAVDSVLPLAEVVQAHTRAEQTANGKVVVALPR